MDLASEWVRCREWLLPSIKLHEKFYTEADIIDGLVTGTYHLRSGSKSAIIYTITEYPVSSALELLIAGGELEELKTLAKRLETVARDKGCEHIQVFGRRAWTRALGYTEILSVGIKEL